ncbi:FG-GAP repeat domain-containing protein [Streptomyces mirabilis]|uniref:FG-GAP repeat domain-containing protein n=1 Tax=Streptomyces mirabilis TaxID=68239 RepID=UPI0036EA7635
MLPAAGDAAIADSERGYLPRLVHAGVPPGVRQNPDDIHAVHHAGNVGLASPGDITGDGRGDLIARQASTGDIYLYKATSSGKLSARVKIFSKWSGYKKIIGVGDLNGDGYGEGSSFGPHREVGLHDRVRRIVKADFVLGERMRRSAWRAASSRGLGYLM